MIKSYEVVITETAQKDMFAIWDYIAMDSIGNAGRFLNQLEEKIYSLEYLPERGHVIPESEYLRTTRYRQLIHKKYRIIYRVDEQTVYILRMFQGSKLLDMASLELETE